MSELKMMAVKMVHAIRHSEIKVGDSGMGDLKRDKRQYQDACKKMSAKLGVEGQMKGKVEFKIEDSGQDTDDRILTATCYMLRRSDVEKIIALLQGKLK